MNTPTIPASTIEPTRPGLLGIGSPKLPTIDGDELASAWLARNGVHVFRVVKLERPETFAPAEEE